MEINLIKKETDKPGILLIDKKKVLFKNTKLINPKGLSKKERKMIESNLRDIKNA